MFESPSGDRPPGGLFRDTARNLALADVATRDLATELLHRLRRGDDMNDVGGNLPELLATVGMEADARLDMFGNRFSREVRRACFEWVSSHPNFTDGAITDRTFLEVGCGAMNPLAFGLMWVAFGARRAVGVDLDTVDDVPTAVRALARMAGWLMTTPQTLFGTEFAPSRGTILDRLEGFDLARMETGEAEGVDMDKLSLQHTPVEKLELEDGECGLVFSSAFLEHVPDVGAALAEIARVTAPGGLGVHNIDGLDHWSYSDERVRPLEFFTIESDEPIVHSSNRVLPVDYPAIFEQHGLEVVKSTLSMHQEITPEFRADLVEPFASRTDEELSPAGIMIWTRKRG